MATANKQSLREEFDALKAQFAALLAAGKITTETRTLIQAMLMLFELLLAVWMEKHTKKDSANSSIPSSQTGKDDSAITHPGANGKGLKQNEARCGNTRTVETVSVTWTPGSSNAPIAKRTPKDNSRLTCPARCNTGRASRPMS